MKKILYLICCFSAISIIAQPSIPYVNWGFINKDRFYVSGQSLSPNPVPTGNGVTWDFTGLTADPTDSIVVVSQGGSTSFSFDFPKANVTFAEYYAASNETYIEHYYKDQWEFSYMGAASLLSGAYPYSTYRKMLKFPMAFNTSFKAYYSISSTKGYVIVKYDGYGTLKLPAATHTNVYRTTCKDSISPTDISYRYEWFDLSRKIMTMEVSKASKTTVTYLNNRVKPSSNISKTEILSPQIQAYPNPGTGLFNLSLPGNISEGQIEVTNIFGQLIISQKINSPNPSFYIENKGLYLVTVSSGQQKYSQRLMVN